MPSTALPCLWILPIIHDNRINSNQIMYNTRTHCSFLLPPLLCYIRTPILLYTGSIIRHGLATTHLAERLKIRRPTGCGIEIDGHRKTWKRTNERVNTQWVFMNPWGRGNWANDQVPPSFLLFRHIRVRRRRGPCSSHLARPVLKTLRRAWTTAQGLSSLCKESESPNKEQTSAHTSRVVCWGKHQKKI